MQSKDTFLIDSIYGVLVFLGSLFFPWWLVCIFAYGLHLVGGFYLGIPLACILLYFKTGESLSVVTLTILFCIWYATVFFQEKDAYFNKKQYL